MNASYLAPLIAVLTFGCAAVGPDHVPPTAAVPGHWRAPLETPPGNEATLIARPARLDRWWQQLGDPLLDQLVERAIGQGLDVREAVARVREARALRGATAAGYLPTVDGSAGYERRGESENTPLGGLVPDSDLFAAGFDASWELDLWGRVRRSVEAADADLRASFADARDVAVTVSAETAVQYVLLRAFQHRTEIARDNVRLQEETLTLVRTRFQAGLVGERDLAQAATNVESTRSRLPALEAAARTAENRLAVLLGQAPGALAAELAPGGAIPVPPVEVAVGLPADLLRRRADVRRAEARLAAETARIGVAKGELYPRLSLLGSIGLQAERAADLLEHGSSFFGFGPSLRWNLFDGGRLRRQVAAQDARAEQALLRWERTVLVALEEAENAMTAFVREQVRHRSLLAAVTQARRAVGFAQTQYREGLSDFQAVLDSERARAELEDEVAQSAATITTNLIALYKALGGGGEGLAGSAD